MEGIRDGVTGVTLCDIVVSIGLARSRTKVEHMGVKATPWVLDVKC